MANAEPNIYFFVSILRFKKAKLCGWAIMKANLVIKGTSKQKNNRLDALLVQVIAIWPFDGVWNRVCEQA